VIDLMVEAIERGDIGETSSTLRPSRTSWRWSHSLWAAWAPALLFAVLRGYDIQLSDQARYVPGVMAAVITAVPMILISRDVNVTATASKDVGSLWLAAAFLVWGALLSWAYYRLYPPPEYAPLPTVEAAPLATVESISRRRFLIRVGTASATLTIVGAGIGRVLQYLDEKEYEDLIKQRRTAAANMPDDLPNAGDPLVPAPGTRPEYTPLEDHYRIDINSRPPEIDGETWRLQITGLVDNPLTLTLGDLKNNYNALDQYVTLACISNSIGGDLTSTTRWTGVSLQDVLKDAKLQPSATHLKIMAEDGFYETVALDEVEADRRVMLTYNWDGIPLLYKHGFPLRIYIPDRYGMKQPKWITDIEVMDHDEDGYRAERGWDKEARMRATSVVDVIAGDMTTSATVRYVPVGGSGHAGARGFRRSRCG
jgi:DMSO/TMAO reductase YedYZ molybdopterin-dependent catalytic subunit